MSLGSYPSIPWSRPGKPRPAAPGALIPGPGRIGKRPRIPCFPTRAESGIGVRRRPREIPPKTGNGGSDSRFPSDVRASTAVDSEYTQPRVSCQCPHRQHAAPTTSIQGPREGAWLSMLLRVSDEHQLQWTRNIHSREHHASASALTGSMRLRVRLLFTEGPREGTCSCHLLPRLPVRKVTRGSRILPVAQPGTDVMRDVLRLVDVDLLQNCNGRSTIAQADDLLKRVVRHHDSDGGLVMASCPVPVA